MKHRNYLRWAAALAVTTLAGGAQAATIQLPATAALPLGSSSSRGFLVRTVQGPFEPALLNNSIRAIKQLNGTLTDDTGTLLENEAVPGPNADGGYDADYINFEVDGLDATIKTVDGTELVTFTSLPFPGIPGNNGHTANFTTEVVGYLELTKGLHEFGVSVTAERTDVNNDDSFILTSGLNPRSAFALKVGEFERIAPGFQNKWRNENRFTVEAPVAGIYPFRIVQWQTGMSSSLDFYTIDVVDGVEYRTLVNDPAIETALKSYKDTTVAGAKGPYISQVSPAPGSDGNSAAAPIEAVVVDGAATVETSGVKLYLNEVKVTPQSLAKSGNKIVLAYNPNAARPDKNNIVRLEYTDSVGTSRTNSWNFGIVVAGGGGTSVAGQWDFNSGDLRATVGQALEYLDGAAGETATKTRFGTTGEGDLVDVPLIDGRAAKVMEVPGDLSDKIGYTVKHGIAPNGGGTRVNQYTLVMDVFVDTTGPGAASLWQTSSAANTDDGDLFWQGNNFGQGTDGYKGRGTFKAGEWHRIVAAYDEAATPPVVAKFVDGIKQDDWTANQSLDAARRSLGTTAVLFGDGDHDERRRMWVNSVQIRSGKITDSEAVALGGPSAAGIPQVIPSSSVTGQWDFEFGDLGATVGKPLQYLDGADGETKAGTEFTTAQIGGQDAKVMRVPGDLSDKIGYIMDHGIKPNGGGTKVNQYTIVYDILVGTTGPGAASLLQTSSTGNTDDGDLFWQGNNFGQGTDGYKGRGTFTAGEWHRVVAAYDEAATPPVVTKYVDGIKQDDWTANQGLDAARRALQPTAVLFGDGDHDERREMWVNSIQIRNGKLSDAEIVALGGPSAGGIPVVVPRTTVTGQWDFEFGDLGATVGKPLQYLDGADGETKAGTEFTTAQIGGQDAKVMRVPGDLSDKIGYIMDHGIKPNGGGTKVNQYTIVYDILVGTSGPGAASLLQTSSTGNTDDGDLFWQGNNFGQGTDGYKGRGTFTAGEWHRVVAAYDEAATPPVVTKYVDGIKQDDWTANQGLDAARRALQPTAVLFGDGDHDERREMWVNSIQIRNGKLSDAEIVALGGPSAGGIPVAIPETTVTGQWDFNFGDLGATVGKPLQYLDGADGETKAGTEFLVVPINDVDAKVMKVPGDLSDKIGYIMDHGIAPNGGGSKVNQYTILFDIYVTTSGPGAASLLQTSSLANTDDGDLFWQGSNFGQGTDGYKGTGIFKAGEWHRVIAAYDEAANPPVVTKYVDGIKQDDWTANQGLDNPRRALQPQAVLFGDGDHDERREMWVNSIQIRKGKLSDLEMEALGGPTAAGLPVVIGAAPVVVPPPALKVGRNADGSLTVSWSSADEWVLESKSALVDGAWTVVSGVANNSVTLNPTDTAFLRLRR